MDEESSTKFIGSLTKFLQSLCNGYVEFDEGVELIGHIYLSVDSGKTKKLNYFLNEKVCKNDNSVTFISNSFHAQPESKDKGKDSEGKKDDVSDAGDSVPKSTNSGTIPSRAQLASRSAASPNHSRPGVQHGTKRPGSPLSAPTAPSQRRMGGIQSAVRSSVGSPVSKTVPSSPSSSSQDNIPSPSPARKNRTEISQPPSNQSDNASVDNENDIVPSNIMTINPPPDFASFIGSLTSDNQTSRDQRSPIDMKPDTDVTFIKEEFVSEPSSCAQTGSSGPSGRSNDDLYPVMMHQNQSVFPSTSSYPSATATSQHPGYPGASTSQNDPFNQDGADPSARAACTSTSAGSTPSVSVVEKRRDSSEDSYYWGMPQQSWPPAPSQQGGQMDCGLAWHPPRPSGGGGGGSSPKFHPQVVADAVLREDGSWSLVCGPCGQAFASDEQLYGHMRGAHKVYVCGQCRMGFNSFANLSYHRNKKHGHNVDLQCLHCGKFFGHRQNLIQHTIKVHNKHVAQSQLQSQSPQQF